MTYNAFISYSHSADDILAPRLQVALRDFAKPWYRRRALSIFRDETGLGTNPGLWSSIAAAMDDSDFFILLASPAAAESEWVNREIEHWKAHKDPARLLPVLTEGEWHWDPDRNDFDWSASTAVPPALAGVFNEEPRHLDLRWAKEDAQLDLRNGRFRDQVADLAAPIHGVAKDEIEGADVHQHRRTIRTAWAAAILLVVLSVASVAGALNAQHAAQVAQEKEAAAVEARNDADTQRTKAEDNLAYATEARKQSQLNMEEASNQRDEAARQRAEAERNAQEADRQRAAAEANAAATNEAKNQADANAAEATSQRSKAEANATTAEANAARARANQATADANATEANTQRMIAEANALDAAARKEEAEANQRNAEAQQMAAEQARAELQVSNGELEEQLEENQELLLANEQLNEQQAEAIRALKNETSNLESARLAALSLSLGEEQPDLALLAAVEAMRVGGDETSAARSALFTTLQRATGIKAILTPPTGSSRGSTAISNDGRFAAMATRSPEQIVVWDLTSPATAPRVVTLPEGEYLTSNPMRFDPSGRTITANVAPAPDDNGVVQYASWYVVFDVATSRQLFRSVADRRPDFCATPDGRFATLEILNDDRSTVYVINLGTGALIAELDALVANDMAPISENVAAPRSCADHNFSADGRYLLAWSKTAAQWATYDLENGATEHPLDSKAEPGLGIPRFDSTGAHLVALTGATGLAVFDPATGAAAAVAPVPTTVPIANYNIAPRGSHVAAVTERGTLFVVDMATSTTAVTLDLGCPNAVDFSAGSQWLVMMESLDFGCGLGTHTVRYLHLATGQITAAVRGLPVAIGQTGEGVELTALVDDKGIGQLDLMTGEWSFRDEPIERWLVPARSTDNQLVAAPSNDGARLWPTTTSFTEESFDRPFIDLPGPTNLGSLAFSYASHTLVGATATESALIVWDPAGLEQGEKVTSIDALLDDSFSEWVYSPDLALDATVRSCDLFNGGRNPDCGPAHASVARILTTSRDQVTTVPLRTDANHLWFTPDSARLVATLTDGSDLPTPMPRSSIIDARSGVLVAEVAEEIKAVSADGGIAAGVNPNRLGVTIRRGDDFSLLRHLPMPERVGPLFLDPDGSLLVALTVDGTKPVDLLAFDVASGSLLTRQPVSDQTGNGLLRLTFSPDGRRAFIDGVDGVDTVVQLWDTATWQRTAVQRVAIGNGMMGSAPAVSPDGALYVVHGQLLNGTTLRPIGSWLVDGDVDTILASRFTPDGRHLEVRAGRRDAVAAMRQQIVRYLVDAAALEREACRLAGRNLTPTEWVQLHPDLAYEPTCAEWGA